MSGINILRSGAIAVAFALASVSGGAYAANALNLFVGGPNSASDEDGEYLIDRNFTVTGQLDVGDSLRGLFNINTVNSAGGNIGGATGVDELTGVFQALVVGKVQLAPPSPITPAGIFAYQFAPDPAFEADLGGGQTVAPVGFVPGPGALVVMFSDPSNNFARDFNNPAPSVPPAGPDDGTPGQTVPPSSADVSVGPYLTEEAFIATARDGAHFWTLGWTGGDPDGDGITNANPLAGEGWSALTDGLGDNVLQAFLFASGVSGGNFNVGLTRLFNGNPGLADGVTVLPITAGAFGLTEFAASGQLRGVNDLDTPFEVSSNLNISFFVVPEPATLALLGAGLAGLGFGTRRRAKRG